MADSSYSIEFGQLGLVLTVYLMLVPTSDHSQEEKSLALLETRGSREKTGLVD